MSVFQLLYVSGTTGPMPAAELDAILGVSRANNALFGITGVLLHADGAFIQVLEGPERRTRETLARIARDPRHRNLMTMVERQAAMRSFASWEMGFRQLDRQREGDQRLFRTTRAALAGRIGLADGGLMLDLVLAFGRDFIAD